jgi:hypothetical protein
VGSVPEIGVSFSLDEVVFASGSPRDPAASATIEPALRPRIVDLFLTAGLDKGPRILTIVR